MKKWTPIRMIVTIGCLAAAVALSVFIVLAAQRTEGNSGDEHFDSVNARIISPKTFCSYGELMFAYVGEHNYLYNLDDETRPLIIQPVKELLYASDDSVLYTTSCELDISHPGRESAIQELQIGEQENRLNTIARVVVDPCWSSNDEVIYYVEEAAPNQLCTFEPLTSTTETAAIFEQNVHSLRISSDGLLVTLADGSEQLYVPLSKKLTEPLIMTKGNMITVCEQYDLFLSSEGILSYHWQGAGELVRIAENTLTGISYQDNEIYYIQKNNDNVFLMSYTVSEDSHNMLCPLDKTILPQMTANADYVFMINEGGVVYRYDVQNNILIPYCFVDMENVKAPMISLFDYRLMIYDLSKEPDAAFCYEVPCDTFVSAEEHEKNQAQADAILAEMPDLLQNSEYRYLSMGAVGEDVSVLQSRLNANGYLTLEPSGIYGAETMYAVSLAQSDLGMEETGNADRLFQSLLNRSEESFRLRSVSEEDRGMRVGNIRARLITLGYLVSLPGNQVDDLLLDAANRFCDQNEYRFDHIITEELQQSIFNKDAPHYNGYIALQEGAVGDACFALNARLQNLGYSAFAPRPDIDRNTMEAVRLFVQANPMEYGEGISAELQTRIFSEDAVPCPAEMAPARLSDSDSATRGQVITDKELKIMRKWLTKSFAVNHTDKQAVKRFQVRLKHLGYLDSNDITMIYDEKTASAVKQFQADNDLVVDGKPAKRTLMAVFGINHSTLSGE